MSGPAIRYASVVRVNQKWRTADIVMMDDGWRAGDVPILSMYVSSDTGDWSMHDAPPPPSEDAAGGLQPSSEKRTVMAVCLMSEGRPLIIGFQPHPLTQLAFTDANRDVRRHPSGVYWTTRDDGTTEYFTNDEAQSFVRIGVGEEHEDLAPLCANENWKLPDAKPAVTLTIQLKGFKMIVRPGGDTIITSDGNLNVDYKQNATVHIGGNATVTVDGNVDATVGGNVTADVHGNLTGHVGGAVKLNVDGTVDLTAGGVINATYPHLYLHGPVDIDGDLNVSGGTAIGGGETVAGNIVSGADVSAGGGSVSLITHVHPGVRSGEDVTLPGVG